MKKILKFFFMSVVSVCMLTSCVTTSVAYKDTAEELLLFMDDSLETKDYSLEEMKKWNVLLIDTPNTDRSTELLDKLSNDMDKYKNPTAAQDTKMNEVKVKIENSLKKCFKSVSYGENSDEKYDLIILVDYQVNLGKKSLDKTESTLTYFFVYSSKNTSYEKTCKFLFRNYIEAKGVGVLPYPANSYGVQDSVLNCVGVIEESLQTGLRMFKTNEIIGPQNYSDIFNNDLYEPEDIKQSATTELLKTQLEKLKL